MTAAWSRRRWQTIAGVVALSLAGLAAWLTLERLRREAVAHTLPPVAAIDVASIFPAPVPVRITITVNWMKVPVKVFPAMLVSDEQLWTRMHFDDWDTLSPDLRKRGLRAVVARYRYLVRNPREWDVMDASDWDAVPQPVRAMAFMNMMQYWSGYYQVGARHSQPRGTTTNTLNAILMVESWFEHRALSTSRSGNRDLGLGQASDYARRTMERLFRGGAIDFAPDDDAAYFNPWVATRMTAIWLELMLDEQRGDLDAAIRAYHAGSPQSSTQAADQYLLNVLQKRRRFMRDKIGTPSWQLLVSLSENPSVSGAASRIPPTAARGQTRARQ